MSKENQRLVYLDMLRILATLGVIVLHCSCYGFNTDSLCPSWYYAMIWDSLVRWSVPVFVMISGALFLTPKKCLTYQSLLLRYIPRLILAYLFWAIFYYFIFDFDDVFSIKKLAISESYFHLWFLPLLAGVYLLIPIMRKTVEDNKLTRYTLTLWMVFLLYNFFSIFLPIKLPHIWPLFVINSVIAFSGYYILGYYLSQHLCTKRTKLWIFITGALGALFTIVSTIIISIKKGKPSEQFFDYLCPNVIAMAVALFVLIKETSHRYGKRIKGICEYVRKDLFGVYLIHLFWLNLINPGNILPECSGFIKLLKLPIISIVVFILSLYSIKLIRLIPGLKKVVE